MSTAKPGATSDGATLSPTLFLSYWEAKHRSDTYGHSGISDGLASRLCQLFANATLPLVDHGCGQGRIALLLASNGHRVVLNDLSVTALTLAQATLAQHRLDSRVAAVVAGPICEWSSPMQCDGFVSHRVLHTMPYPDRLRAVATLAKYLSSGCPALITVRSVHCPRYALMDKDPTFVRITEPTGHTFVRRNPFRFLHFFERDEICALLQSQGLMIIACDEVVEQTGNRLRPADTVFNKYWIVQCNRCG